MEEQKRQIAKDRLMASSSAFESQQSEPQPSSEIHAASQTSLTQSGHHTDSADLIGKSPCFGAGTASVEDLDQSSHLATPLDKFKAFKSDNEDSSSQLLCAPNGAKLPSSNGASRPASSTQLWNQTAESSMLTQNSNILKAYTNQRNSMTGREALMLSEPEDDMPCSDFECCKEKKAAEREDGEQVSSPLRRLAIKTQEVTNSPLKDFDEKMSPLRQSIHEMITNEVSYDRRDIETLMQQIDQMQAQIDHLTEQANEAVMNLNRERTFRVHIQRALRKQEQTFSIQQREQMRMVEAQLKEQESFVLGIKLNLASLNKNYMEARSDLKREQVKSATYAVEKKNLQSCLIGVKQALEETQADLNKKQIEMKQAQDQLQQIKQEQTVLQGQNQELQTQVEQLQDQVQEAQQQREGAEERARALEQEMVDFQKENIELKRRIELISNLRGGADHLRQSSNPVESLRQVELSEGARSVVSRSAVDSAWSQAQACGSVQSGRLEMIMKDQESLASHSGKEESEAESAIEDFYNPMPTKTFTKHYQPSLVFKSRAAREELEAQKPGIDFAASTLGYRRQVLPTVKFTDSSRASRFESRGTAEVSNFSAQQSSYVQVQARPKYTIGLQKVSYQQVDR